MSDVLLDRLERTATVCCAAMAAVALAVTRGNWWAAAAVVGGGALVGISFYSIRSGIEDLMTPRRARNARVLLKMVGRYALLGFLAYVMIARLRLPPLGLVAGASSVTAAVALETARLLWKN